MMTDEDVDLIAKYLVCRLSVMLELNQYHGATPKQLEEWQEQLEQTKRELIANGLGKQV